MTGVISGPANAGLPGPWAPALSTRLIFASFNSSCDIFILKPKYMLSKLINKLTYNKRVDAYAASNEIPLCGREGLVTGTITWPPHVAITLTIISALSGIHNVATIYKIAGQCITNFAKLE